MERPMSAHQRCPALAIVVVIALALLLAACERETRNFQQPPSAGVAPQVIPMTTLQAGVATASPRADNPSERRAFDLSEGKRLFAWYNCNGCHANGGGDKGPALMDDVWIYGSEPANIYATIVEGRPNGMPSFRGRIPEAQLWSIVAYVRSLSGLVAKDVATSRNDSMQAKPAENAIDRATPWQAAVPSASER